MPLGTRYYTAAIRLYSCHTAGAVGVEAMLTCIGTPPVRPKAPPRCVIIPLAIKPLPSKTALAAICILFATVFAAHTLLLTATFLLFAALCPRLRCDYASLRSPGATQYRLTTSPCAYMHLHAHLLPTTLTAYYAPTPIRPYANTPTYYHSMLTYCLQRLNASLRPYALLPMRCCCLYHVARILLIVCHVTFCDTICHKCSMRVEMLVQYAVCECSTRQANACIHTVPIQFYHSITTVLSPPSHVYCQPAPVHQSW